MAAVEVRRVLKCYDDAAVAPTRQAIQMLRETTKSISKDPAAYDLLGDGELWAQGGGESYCHNDDFPSVLGDRWVEVLSKPDVPKLGWDKEEWQNLHDDLTFWGKKLADAGLELGRLDEALALAAQYKEAAPEPEDSDEDDEEDEE